MCQMCDMYTMEQIVNRAVKHQARHRDGFPYTRDGIRLGIATLEDEVNALWTVWDSIKDEMPFASVDELEGKLLDIAAVSLMMLRAVLAAKVKDSGAP